MLASSHARATITVVSLRVPIALAIMCIPVGAVFLTGCGGEQGTDGAATATGAGAPTVIRVPADQPTVQQAVDAADEGAMVLISPGTYPEAVTVTTPRIVIRGLDRNRVILDGGDVRDNGITVQADGVAVENLTVRRYTDNGVLVNGAWEYTAGGTPHEGDGVAGEDQMKASGGEPGAGDEVVRGYRISYVTAYNNGLYGLYAFASRNGLIEHSYASGHPDSGVYIGQCRPCNAVVRKTVMAVNAIGYFGTNTNGGVTVVDSVMKDNRLGAALNSDDAELLAPARGTAFVGNVVTGNQNPKAPEIAEGFTGGGVGIRGGVDHMIERNLITGNGGAGVLVIDADGHRARGNRVAGNVLREHSFDLVAQAKTPGCFAGNLYSTSDPANIEKVYPCTGRPTAAKQAQGYRPPPSPPTVDYTAIPPPPRQPNMPNAAAAPARPAVDMPPPINPGRYRLPPG